MLLYKILLGTICMCYTYTIYLKYWKTTVRMIAWKHCVLHTYCKFENWLIFISFGYNGVLRSISTYINLPNFDACSTLLKLIPPDTFWPWSIFFTDIRIPAKSNPNKYNYLPAIVITIGIFITPLHVTRHSVRLQSLWYTYKSNFNIFYQWTTLPVTVAMERDNEFLITILHTISANSTWCVLYPRP